MECGVIFFWVVCGFGTAAIAKSKGRDSMGWFWLGLLLGPIGILIIGFMEKVQLDIAPRNEAINPINHPSSSGDSDRTKCPFCAELILKEAKICRFCGRDLPLPPAPPPLPPKPLDEVVKERLQEADRQFSSGNKDEALAAYIRVSEEFPDETGIWLRLRTMANAPEEVKAKARFNLQRLGNTL